MADVDGKRAALLTVLVGSVAGVMLAHPGARRWLRRALEAVREWVEYSAEDLGQLLEAWAERSAALRRTAGPVTIATARRADEHLIISRIREALARDPHVHARKIRISLIGGVVHLEGMVDSLEEKEIVGELAQEAARTHIIVNDLQLAQVAGPTP